MRRSLLLFVCCRPHMFFSDIVKTLIRLCGPICLSPVKGLPATGRLVMPLLPASVSTLELTNSSSLVARPVYIYSQFPNCRLVTPGDRLLVFNRASMQRSSTALAMRPFPAERHRLPFVFGAST